MSIISSPPAQPAVDLATHCRAIAERARQAALELADGKTPAKRACLRAVAAAIRSKVGRILEANTNDLAAAPGFGLTAAAVDRLRLDEARVAGIAAGVEAVAALPDPVGEVIEQRTLANGLDVRKVRVPLGVVLFIY